MIHLEVEGAMAAQKNKCASKNFSTYQTLHVLVSKKSLSKADQQNDKFFTKCKLGRFKQRELKYFGLQMISS